MSLFLWHPLLGQNRPSNLARLGGVLKIELSDDWKNCHTRPMTKAIVSIIITISLFLIGSGTLAQRLNKQWDHDNREQLEIDLREIERRQDETERQLHR